jgi:hypothetical protein
MTLTPPDPITDDATLLDDPCASPRRVVEETCALADRLRALLTAARDDLRKAQRALAVHEERQELATHDADPREVERRKVEAFGAFRLARTSARGPADLEAAATAWLRVIDDVNRRLVEARRVLETERHEVGPLVAELEKRTAAVDRARIAADQASVACREARERLAACAEAGGGAPGRASGPASVLGHVATQDETDGRGAAASAEAAVVAVRPRIVALLHGDVTERDVVAVGLAGGEPGAADRWADLLDDLVAAIVERALEESRFVFPREHRFWGLFRDDECREIAVVLAALGFHPIPGAGWADGRVPGRRDLSLAVGYAGQDPLRIRIWPNEAELAHLFDETSADVVGFLFETAGDLSLGDMVSLLGRRAEQLTALWNVWGRARPLLLAETA